MKSIKPEVRYNFSTSAVVAAVENAKPCLYTPKQAANLDTYKMIHILRTHELSDYYECEQNEEYAPTCDITNGYQGYVEETIINYFS